MNRDEVCERLREVACEIDRMICCCAFLKPEWCSALNELGDYLRHVAAELEIKEAPVMATVVIQEYGGEG